MTDPIADFLTRIRNAVRAHHKQVEIPASKMKVGLTEILYQQNFINGFSILNDTPQGTIRIYLRYSQDGAPVIEGLQRVSSPGLRHYSPGKGHPSHPERSRCDDRVHPEGTAHRRAGAPAERWRRSTVQNLVKINRQGVVTCPE
jgi:small subunit ribosomal protein S8